MTEKSAKSADRRDAAGASPQPRCIGLNASASSVQLLNCHPKAADVSVRTRRSSLATSGNNLQTIVRNRKPKYGIASSDSGIGPSDSAKTSGDNGIGRRENGRKCRENGEKSSDDGKTPGDNEGTRNGNRRRANVGNGWVVVCHAGLIDRQTMRDGCRVWANDRHAWPNVRHACLDLHDAWLNAHRACRWDDALTHLRELIMSEMRFAP